MAGEDQLANFYVHSGNEIGGILESEIDKKSNPCSILVFPCSDEQKQDALYNAAPSCPQVVIVNPKKPAQYKMFSGPEGEYLYSERCVPVQIAIINPRPGLEFSVWARNKALTHQHEAVQACHEHVNLTPSAGTKFMYLRTTNQAAFVLMAGCSRSVTHDLDGLHPIARVTVNAEAKRDFVNLVFPCYSSCKPRKNCGNLMLLHLNIRDINTREIVFTSELTVRVAANVLARAFKKYEEDMLGKKAPRCPSNRLMPLQSGECLHDTAEVVDDVDDTDVNDVMDSDLNQNGEERDTVRVAENLLARAYKKYEEDMLDKTTPRFPAKRLMPDQGGKGLDDTAEVMNIVAKHPKLEHGNERKDDASDVVDVIHSELNQDDERNNTFEVGNSVVDHPDVNHDGKGYDDPDVVEMAEYLCEDRFAKEAVQRTIADIQAWASSSMLEADDNCNVNETGSASNQLTLLEASQSTNKFTVNIGAASGISLDSMACTDSLPNAMVNHQTSTVPISNKSALTVLNQNQMPPEGCSLLNSSSLDCSNKPPVSLQECAVSDGVAFVVTGLKNPEWDGSKIQQYIESLGASCLQVPVFIQD